MRSYRDWFWSRRLAERAQDTEYHDVGRENAEADGSDHGEAEDKGHQEGNHVRKILEKQKSAAAHFPQRCLTTLARSRTDQWVRRYTTLNLPALTLRAIDD